MSERNPKRFENGSNAQQRSAEEQRHLMEEHDQARYEEAFPVDEAAEKSYDEAMAAREFEKNALIEGRILERQKKEVEGGEDDEYRMALVRPDANFMYMMAQQIAELRAHGGEPMIIEGKENRLQDLLEKYVENAPEGERDERLEEADFIINSTDEAWVNERTPASEEEIKTPKDADSEKDRTDAEKKFVKDPTEARLLAEVERLSRAIKSNPEEAKKAELYDKVEELLGEIEAAIAAAKKSEEELKTPKDAKSDDEEIKTPKDAKSDDEEEIKTPKDAKSDEEEIKTPKDAKSDDEEKDGKKEEERISGWRHPFAYVGALFTVRGGSLMERFRSSDKKKVIAVAGAVAVVGSIIAWRLGAFGHGGGGGGHQAQDFTPGQKGGHPGGDGHIDTPPPTPKATPEIPSGDAYAHPWNWMKAAMENGSIKAPTGMGPEQALHHYGELAEAAGHKVEWYNLPNGLEAIRIDGSDDTAYIGDVIGQVAK